MVFQSRAYLDSYVPLGLPMGTRLAELEDMLVETPEEVSGPGDALVLDALISDVPDRPEGAGTLRFRVRASEQGGLCHIKAVLHTPEKSNFEHLFESASVMPAADLFGVVHKFGGVSAGFKLSLLPQPISPTHQQAWYSSVEEPLPGSLDAVDFLRGSGEVDGVKSHLEMVEYLFTNADSCGMSRDDLFNVR